MAYQDDLKDINAQADFARKRVVQQEGSALAGQKQALVRRAAQMGGAPGGALIKQERIAANDSAQRVAQAGEGIEANAMGARMQARQAEDSRVFARSEREAGQGFAATQADLQRRFMTGEREAGQTFARGEREAGQGFATTMADKQAQLQREMQEKGIAAASHENYWNREMAKSHFGQQMDRDWAKFQHEIEIDEFNKGLATKMANQKDTLEQVFSGESPLLKFSPAYHIYNTGKRWLGK